MLSYCFHFISTFLRDKLTVDLCLIKATRCGLRYLEHMLRDFPARATVAAELQPVFQLEYQQTDQADEMLLHEHQSRNNLRRCFFWFVCD